MPTYRIIHYTNESQLGNDVLVLSSFNKTELQMKFDEVAKGLLPGESVEYMKEDNKRFYPSMLYVVNENGQLYLYKLKGRRKYIPKF